MNTTDQVITIRAIAIAELDGWKHIPSGKDSFSAYFEDCANRGHETILVRNLPPYFTSLDAIVPVILKQDIETQQECFRQLFRECFKADTPTTSSLTFSLEEIFHKTPLQLCEALLRAAGKLNEEAKL